MTPEDRLRGLRRDERWEPTTLTPRMRVATAEAPPRYPRAGSPAFVTAVVAVLVAAVSIGFIQLGANRSARPPAAPATSTAIPAPVVRGATATIRGSAPTTTRIILGAGVPGGPSAAEIRTLQAQARHAGKFVGQPSTSSSADARVSSAVQSVTAAFGSTLHDIGGSGTRDQTFFIVLNRPPTPQELQLLHLLPFTMRLTWGPRLGVRERDREQQAAFLAVDDLLDAGSITEPETDTLSVSFWPDRDHPKSAAQVADEMAVTIKNLSGHAPTFAIEVTDRSKTPAGQAALHAKSHPLPENGVRLLIGARPTRADFGVGTGGRFGLDHQRCVALDDVVIIAPPGSSISADGRTIRAAGIGTYPVSPGRPPAGSFTNLELGGEFVDAAIAATYLPRGSTLCGATKFLLLG